MFSWFSSAHVLRSQFWREICPMEHILARLESDSRRCAAPGGEAHLQLLPAGEPAGAVWCGAVWALLQMSHADCAQVLPVRARAHRPAPTHGYARPGPAHAVPPHPAPLPLSPQAPAPPGPALHPRRLVRSHLPHPWHQASCAGAVCAMTENMRYTHTSAVLNEVP